MSVRISAIVALLFGIFLISVSCHFAYLMSVCITYGLIFQIQAQTPSPGKLFALAIYLKVTVTTIKG